MADEKTQFDEQELEQYGVWVKAGSEEVVAADDTLMLTDLPTDDEPIATPTQPDGEINIDEIDATGEDGDNLKEPVPEEFGDDDLEPDDASDLGGPASTQPSESPRDDDQGLDLPDLDDIALDDEIDLVLDDMEDMPTMEAMESGDDDGDKPKDDSHMVSLDDFDIEEPENEPDPFSVLSNDEPSVVEASGPAPALDDNAQPPDGAAAEINLDKFNEDTSESIDAEGASTDFDAPPPNSDESIPGSDSEIDDLRLDDITIDDDEELPELEENEHDFTTENQAIAIIPEGPPTTISEEEAEFLSNGIDSPSVDLNAVTKIQSELAEIRHELADLKRALREGRGADPLTTPEHSTSIAEEPQASPKVEAELGPGFFDEDEDETIALTGDELDNILNTAEFTEETGETAEMDDDFMIALEPDAPQGTSVKAPQPEAAADSIDLEPVESAPFVVEGDESAVDELANMSIDQELADIEQLSDDDNTESEFETVELDMDTVDETDEATSVGDAAQPDTVVSDDLEAFDVDSDFDSFTDAIEQELDVAAATEPTADEITIEELDLEDSEPPAHATDRVSDETIEPVPDDADFVNAPSVPVGDGTSIGELPDRLKDEIRSVLSYMDQLLAVLPDDKIEEFAQSEHFAVYKRLFEELGLES